MSRSHLHNTAAHTPPRAERLGSQRRNCPHRREREGGALVPGSRGYAPGFTLIELIIVVALLGVIALIVGTNVSMTEWMDPPKMILQRALTEAADMARNGVSVRFRIDKTTNLGEVVTEMYMKEDEAAAAEAAPSIFAPARKPEAGWKPFNLQWRLTGTDWTFDPEIIYFSRDGICTPAKISNGAGGEKFLLTVTGYLVDDGLPR